MMWLIVQPLLVYQPDGFFNHGGTVTRRREKSLCNGFSLWYCNKYLFLLLAGRSTVSHYKQKIVEIVVK